MNLAGTSRGLPHSHWHIASHKFLVGWYDNVRHCDLPHQHDSFRTPLWYCKDGQSLVTSFSGRIYLHACGVGYGQRSLLIVYIKSAGHCGECYMMPHSSQRFEKSLVFSGIAEANQSEPAGHPVFAYFCIWVF